MPTPLLRYLVGECDAYNVAHVRQTSAVVVRDIAAARCGQPLSTHRHPCLLLSAWSTVLSTKTKTKRKMMRMKMKMERRRGQQEGSQRLSWAPLAPCARGGDVIRQFSQKVCSAPNEQKGSLAPVSAPQEEPFRRGASASGDIQSSGTCATCIVLHEPIFPSLHLVLHAAASKIFNVYY